MNKRMGKAEWGLLYSALDTVVTVMVGVCIYEVWGIAPALAAGLVLTMGFNYVGKRFGLNG